MCYDEYKSGKTFLFSFSRLEPYEPGQYPTGLCHSLQPDLTRRGYDLKIYSCEHASRRYRPDYTGRVSP